MAKKVRVKYEKGAFRELRTDPGVSSDIDGRGQQVLDAANASGNGTYYMQSETTGGKGRHRVAVHTGDIQSMRSEAKNSGATLLSSLDAGRGQAP
ncbi:hypothetical protein [Corynebacterium glyciniphilum]|uniref:hypothetical protein n=1 Tax=Corynebacterium glyciniphilum TaxID=1404244 RepID=UPI00264D6D60|nr:hypothetical protein [Corynebacterium glyciniphilum]MDN6706379.1 hypothetical protein [Corynebacterium glyciniphilum]